MVLKRTAPVVIWFVAVSALSCFAADPLVGRWEGTVHIPGNELTLVIDLASDTTGAWTGSVIVPGLDIKGLAVKDLVAKVPDLSFGIKMGAAGGLEATFKGHVNGDGKLTGDFTQAGNTAPVELKQVGPAQVEFPPRSTPLASNVQGEWQGQYELLGYSRQVTLKLFNKGEAAPTAEFVVVGKRVNNLPVDRITQEGTLLTVYSHETGITLEGRLSKDTNEIRGSISQGSMEAPLTLRRK
ncbi:MAG: hypothetical protein ACJ8M1_03950 [Chthoniobacterales bacterium]